jgi:hypothetical protein
VVEVLARQAMHPQHPRRVIHAAVGGWWAEILGRRRRRRRLEWRWSRSRSALLAGVGAERAHRRVKDLRRAADAVLGLVRARISMQKLLTHQS